MKPDALERWNARTSLERVRLIAALEERLAQHRAVLLIALGREELEALEVALALLAERC